MTELNAADFNRIALRAVLDRLKSHLCAGERERDKKRKEREAPTKAGQEGTFSGQNSRQQVWNTLPRNGCFG